MLLVATGAVVAVRPGLLLESVPELGVVLEGVDPELVVLGLAVVFVLFAPTLGITGRRRSSSTTSLVASEPSLEAESRFDEGPSQSDRQPVVGETAEELVTVATAYDDEPRATREEARLALLESLRRIAATAYETHTDRGDDAMAAIEAGTWTDDPRASAFLATADGPRMPLWLWLFDLVSTGEPFERSLERTLEEIERIQSTTGANTPTEPTPADGGLEGVSS
ncbi:hypothetical protein C495_09395 [Natronorubrum sulfidifaciens JCM 14089]|uniref:Uncharacterized protein n=2 Tax=Natronorubrum sulfidifaciens TaxID=388259 RepID=L9W7B7_9EURY|nr:hypothetical protein C495_09395 [Natronorubrum sulfidifaciens JCM 14089]